MREPISVLSVGLFQFCDRQYILLKRAEQIPEASVVRFLARRGQKKKRTKVGELLLHKGRLNNDLKP
jgi:hypothetical protein